MKWLILLTVLLSTSLRAQHADTFARARDHKTPRALDHWMKRELHRHRKGTRVSNGSTTYTDHTATYDSLVAWLGRQPGVSDAAWDRCLYKLDIWPGHSTIGVRVQLGGVVRERCYTLQEGRPGTIKLPGWRPKVRRSREQLKLVGVRECAGFVAEQRANCRTMKKP